MPLGLPTFQGLCLTALMLAQFPNSTLAQSRQVGDASLAQTPPMGWNSWDSYGPTVREDEVKANADFIAKNLAQYGWQYVVVDIEWYQPNAKAHGYIPRGEVTMDKYGRFVPAPNRFPSAADGEGFKALADYVHSRGLKFGIHIMRGIPRAAVERNLPITGTLYHAADIADEKNVCTWAGMEDTYGVDMSKPGAQAYYDSLVALYAHWGVDLIKADDMARPYHRAEIEALHRAIVKSGRPIVLSLSPGPAPLDEVESLRDNAQMWRIEDDLWDNWPSVKNMFSRAESWAKVVEQGHWPDADMLPLGHIGIRAERGDDRMSRLSHDEQQSLMTLWSIFRSPLMFGGDLPTSDEFSISLITNPEVLQVDQHSTGGEQSYHEGDLIAWTADAPSTSAKYLAVFNVGDTPQTVDLTWGEVGLGVKNPSVRDLWLRKDLGKHNSVHVYLRPHACVFYEVVR